LSKVVTESISTVPVLALESVNITVDSSTGSLNLTVISVVFTLTSVAPLAGEWYDTLGNVSVSKKKI
jgi:hypothetical protein